MAEPTVAERGLIGRKFRFEYENGQHYEVTFESDLVTWRGVKGPDNGQESDPYRLEIVSPDLFLLNWTEKDGSYVTLLIDLPLQRVFSSGASRGGTWWLKGTLVPL